MLAMKCAWAWPRRTRVALLAAGCLVLAAGAGAVPAAAKGRAVSVDFDYPPGSIVIVNNERRLYLLTGEGRAIRYPVAVGTRGELWVGLTFVSNMRKNPPWTPVDGGETVPGGLASNPLGQRALYLDWSLLRIHGTPSRGSIGRAFSDGCIRMLN